jgi:XisH protein
LAQQERDRVLYLAVPVDTYDSFFTLPFTQTVVQQNQLKLIVYNPEKQELVLWQS